MYCNKLHYVTLVCFSDVCPVCDSKISGGFPVALYIHQTKSQCGIHSQLCSGPLKTLLLVDISDQLAIRASPKSPPQGGATTQYCSQGDVIALRLQKRVKLGGSGFIIGTHLFVNNRLYLRGNLGQMPRPWLSGNSASLSVSLDKLIYSTSARLHPFFSEKLCDSWGFVASKVQEENPVTRIDHLQKCVKS